eukprot:47973-Pelagomonas_calceolata.AAC.6
MSKLLGNDDIYPTNDLRDGQDDVQDKQHAIFKCSPPGMLSPADFKCLHPLCSLRRQMGRSGKGSPVELTFSLEECSSSFQVN